MQGHHMQDNHGAHLYPAIADALDCYFSLRKTTTTIEQAVEQTAKRLKPAVSTAQFLQGICKQNLKTKLNAFNNKKNIKTVSPFKHVNIVNKVISNNDSKKIGSDLPHTIDYGVFPCSFGNCFIAKKSTAIVKLTFFDRPHQLESAINELQHDWPHSTVKHNAQAVSDDYQLIFNHTGKPNPNATKPSINLLLKGTDFQIKVWQALLCLAQGGLYSYQHIATLSQHPTATRAAGSAIGKNPIAYLIPCHRIIRSTGEINQYRWGIARKAALLGKESLNR